MESDGLQEVQKKSDPLNRECHILLTGRTPRYHTQAFSPLSVQQRARRDRQYRQGHTSDSSTSGSVPDLGSWSRESTLGLLPGLRSDGDTRTIPRG